MKKVQLGLAILAVTIFCIGCASKVALIKSEPPGANVTVNGNYVGKTPVTYRFRDDWQISIRGTDDYIVEATLEGYHSDTRVFKDTSDFANPEFVPDVIFFELRKK